MAVNLTGVDLSAGAITVDSARKNLHGQPVPAAQSDQRASQQAPGEVSITSTASILAQLQQTLSSRPAVDQQRVAAVKQALAAGTYKFHPDQIADRLIHSERALASLAPDK